MLYVSLAIQTLSEAAGTPRSERLLARICGKRIMQAVSRAASILAQSVDRHFACLVYEDLRSMPMYIQYGVMLLYHIVRGAPFAWW